MILVDEFVKLNVSAEFMEMFRVVIQLGAILAVVYLFFHKLNPLSPKKTTQDRKDVMSLWSKVIVGMLPAAIIGIPLDDWFDEHFYNYPVVAIALIVYGILFIVVENLNRRNRPAVQSFRDLSYKTAFAIGLFQVLSLIPGTSRSGATILGAILLGTSRSLAAEFSFFMSIPVMFGASALKLVKFGFHFTGLETAILLVGMITAFIVSILAIKFLMNYIKKHDFKVFGWYRIVLGVIVIAYFFFTTAV